MAEAASAATPPLPVCSPKDKRRQKRASRVPVAKAPRALRPPGPQARELFASSQQLPEGSDEDPATPSPALGRRRQGLHRPRHVRTILEPGPASTPQLRQPHCFGPARGVRTWCDLCRRYIFSAGQRCADCKYTCHSHCQDLVHLDCQQNGKLIECNSVYDSLAQTDDSGQC